MRSENWRLRVEDILEAIAKVQRYTQGMDFEAFQADQKTIDAVVRNLEIIGEAARHIPDAVREHHSEVPWDRMRGFRNVLAHEYFGVSVPIVWQTTQEDLPTIVPLLSKML